VNLLEFVAVAGDDLEYFGIFFSEPFERQCSDLWADIIYFYVINLYVLGLDVVEGELKFLESPKGEWGFEVDDGAVLDGEASAVLEVVDEGFVEFGLGEVVLLYLDVDVVVL
jgi:hypothetical protein